MIQDNNNTAFDCVICQYFNNLILSKIKKLRTISYFIFLASIIIYLGACGGGNGNGQDEAGKNQRGEVIIGLTDAEGDFLSYTVDVSEIHLVKANGNEINVLPVTTRVDFAQYTELTEFVTSSMVPLGAYKSISMTLDYANADIWVENASGNATQITNIQDSEGNVITELTLQVFLEGRNKLVVSNGRPMHLTLDFDLNVSNKLVTPGEGRPYIVVEPFLVVDVEMQKPKTHRLRGLLLEVDLPDNSFELDIKPFHHNKKNTTRFGNLKVLTNENTLFDIDDISYEGYAGLEVLAGLPEHSPVVVLGNLHVNSHNFIAREVHAGTSVPGGSMDTVKGTVLSRTGNTLIVKGATLINSEGDVSFRDNISVTLAESTIVKKQMSMDEYNIGDISVGQKIAVSGIVTGITEDLVEVDASNGVVRMKLTNLSGSPMFTEEPFSPYFVVDLHKINRCDVSMFNFTGTGSGEGNDANPQMYEVDLGNLDSGDIVEPTMLKIQGFVTPFGSAPADFMATSLMDLSKMPAKLTMNWTPVAADPFTSIDAVGMTLNLAGSGVFHHVGRGGAIVDLSSIETAPTIKGSVDGEGVYEIYGIGRRMSFSSFEAFVDEIETRMSRGKSVKRIAAAGLYNDMTATLTANFISIHIKNH